MVRVRVVEPCQVPAAVVGEVADGVGAVVDELPQVLGRVDAARVAAAHADDRDRLVGDRGHRAGGRRGDRGAREFGAEEGGDRRGGRVVEDQGRGQAQFGDRVEVVPQFDGAE